MANKKYNLICPHCGGENIAIDALAARWCPETEQWEPSCTPDNFTCGDCCTDFIEAKKVAIADD